MRQPKKLFALIPALLLGLIPIAVYGPLLVGLDIPGGIQSRMIAGCVFLYQAAALICGVGGIWLNLRALCRRGKALPCLLRMGLAVLYLAVAFWFCLLLILFAV